MRYGVRALPCVFSFFLRRICAHIRLLPHRWIEGEPSAFTIDTFASGCYPFSPLEKGGLRGI
jgi:hypothetical protein